MLAFESSSRKIQARAPKKKPTMLRVKITRTDVRPKIHRLPMLKTEYIFEKSEQDKGREGALAQRHVCCLEIQWL